ncbi:MAG: ComEA family DNA-binding protein [Lachnospiraceae bacterium]|nr:ComEA family DNA-binding protein [Lachnospiraceae bacterium]
MKIKLLMLLFLTADILFCLLAAACGKEEDFGGKAFLAEESPAEAFSGEEDSSSEAGDSVPGIYVYVCGEVVSPGVYILPEGSRVYEALALAGGLTEEADERGLNQAEKLSDGQKLTVPAVGSAEETFFSEADDGKVNLNTADAEKLMSLPGIGEARAADIIAYREQNGPFALPEDIMKVSGIKQAAYDKIKDRITVR